MDSQRIPELDGIRGFAILLVVIAHYFVIAIYPQPGSFLAYVQLLLINAGSGVDLFFVLSGFLIGGILFDNRESDNYFRTFYARRFFRIFPLYYLFIGIFITAVALGAQHLEVQGNQLFSDPLPLWSYLLYLQNFAAAAVGTFGCAFLSATWSLAIEEHFYLLAPLAMRRTRSAAVVLLLAVIVLAYIARIALTSYQHWQLSAYVVSVCRFDALAIGVLAALALRVTKIRTALERGRRVLYVLWLAGGVVIVLMSVRRVTTTSLEMVYYGYDVFAAFYCLAILLAVVHPSGPLAAVCRFRPLRELGTLAYCVYLLHIPVNALCHSLIQHRAPWIGNGADALVSLLAFVLTVSIARVSWLYFEWPLLRMGRRFTY